MRLLGHQGVSGEERWQVLQGREFTQLVQDVHTLIHEVPTTVQDAKGRANCRGG